MLCCLLPTVLPRSSELTCISDNEYYEKLAYKSFPMITPRMTKITVGLCEWTVAEVTPTQVKRNVFLLGNAWATCTFLPIAEKECAKPIVGGLTMTVQALQYQFAQPKGIREYEESDSAEDEEEQEMVTSSTDKKKSATKAVTASAPTATKQPATRAAVAVAAVAPAKKAASPAAKGSNTTATVTASTAAASKVTSSSKVKGKYLMDVELQNVFLGLITGAFGPKKAQKYK